MNNALTMISIHETTRELKRGRMKVRLMVSVCLTPVVDRVDGRGLTLETMRMGETSTSLTTQARCVAV